MQPYFSPSFPSRNAGEELPEAVANITLEVTDISPTEVSNAEKKKAATVQ